jgi:putative transposase
VRFRFVEEQRGAFPLDRLCRVMNVSPRGLRAFRGRPRMTEELKEVRVDVGHRRVGRLMRESGIVVRRMGKFKAKTNSDHTFNIAPNLLSTISLPINPIRNGRVTSATSGPGRAGSIVR